MKTCSLHPIRSNHRNLWTACLHEPFICKRFAGFPVGCRHGIDQDLCPDSRQPWRRGRAGCGGAAERRTVEKKPCPGKRGECLREDEQDKHQRRLGIEEADMRKLHDNFAFRCRGSCRRRGTRRGEDGVSSLACAPAAMSSSRAPPTEASLAMITRWTWPPGNLQFFALQNNSGS